MRGHAAGNKVKGGELKSLERRFHNGQMAVVHGIKNAPENSDAFFFHGFLDYDFF